MRGKRGGGGAAAEAYDAFLPRATAGQWQLRRKQEPGILQLIPSARLDSEKRCAEVCRTPYRRSLARAAAQRPFPPLWCGQSNVFLVHCVVRCEPRKATQGEKNCRHASKKMGAALGERRAAERQSATRQCRRLQVGCSLLRAGLEDYSDANCCAYCESVLYSPLGATRSMPAVAGVGGARVEPTTHKRRRRLRRCCRHW